MILLQCMIQESDTIDFQDYNHFLASICIPKKRGKDARLFGENQAVR